MAKQTSQGFWVHLTPVIHWFLFLLKNPKVTQKKMFLNFYWKLEILIQLFSSNISLPLEL